MDLLRRAGTRNYVSAGRVVPELRGSLIRHLSSRGYYPFRLSSFLASNAKLHNTKEPSRTKTSAPKVKSVACFSTTKSSKEEGKIIVPGEETAVTASNEAAKATKVGQEESLVIASEEMETPALSIPNLRERTIYYLDEDKVPVGSLDAVAFDEARELVWSWTKLRTPESTKHSIDLLDRLVKEQNLNFHADLTEERVAELLNHNILNAVVKNWSLCWQANEEDETLITPQAILEKMQEWYEQFPNLSPQTTNIHFIMQAALSRVKTLDDALYVESLLTSMIDDFTSGNLWVAPTIKEYNIVLNAMAKANEAERAEDILKRLYDDYMTGVSMLKPDTYSFRTVLHAWKRQGGEHGGERAEAVLNSMIHLGESEGDMVLAQPDTPAYFEVLATWCAPRTRRCLEQAERFLLRMHDDFKAGNETARPTNSCYGLVIHSWSQAGYSEESERVLRWMHNDYAQNNNLQAKPTSYHFNPAIIAWARIGSPQAVGRAFALFEGMKHLNVPPDSATYGALLHGLSRTKDKTAGERAELLLREQQQRYREGNEECKPDVMTFNATMHCWSSVGNANRAVSLLKELVDEHKRGNLKMLDDRPFCTVLAALSRSRYREKTQMAESIYTETNRMCEEGLFDFKPSVNFYSALQGCWASAELPNSGTKCLALLHKMKEKYLAGEEAMRPTEANFKTVIDAFARIGNPHQAEEVWYELLQSYVDGNSDARPGSDSCRALLCSWLMSGLPEGVEKSVEVLERIAEIDRSDTVELRLDRDAYYIILDTCAKSKNQHIVAGAESILRKMKEIHDEGRGAVSPDSRCYNMTINCWRKVGNAERAEALFWEMYKCFVEHGNSLVKPDGITISTVLSAWAMSTNDCAALRAMAFFERVEKLIATGHLSHVKLDSFCYAPLLQSLANAGTEEASETADRIFASLKQRYRAGESHVKPNQASYRAMIKCKSANGRLDEAETLLFESNKFFKGELRNLSCRPILTGWYRSNDKDAPQRAENILRWMSENLKGKERPDSLNHACVLRCWSRSRRPDSGQRAERLLLEIVDKFGKQGRIVKECFSDVVCAWARSNNSERAEELLQRLCEDYRSNRTSAKPEPRAFVSVLAAISRTRQPGVGMRCLGVVQNLRELENSKGDTNVGSKVLSFWNSLPLDDENRLETFLAEMEKLDSVDEVVQGPATDESGSSESLSLAFKY